MATPRRPLQEILSNSTIKMELSLYQHGILVRASRAGTKLSEILQALSIPKSTIHNTLKMQKGESRARKLRISNGSLQGRRINLPHSSLPLSSKILPPYRMIAWAGIYSLDDSPILYY